MSIWLKRRLAVWMGTALVGGALLWQSGALRAQDQDKGNSRALGLNGIPRIKLTRDEAAKSFVALLQRYDDGPRASWNDAPATAMGSSFSRKSERQIGEGLYPFLVKMAAQWKQPQYKVKVQNESGKTATVTVETDSSPTLLPLVLIQEGESWGVDLVETYAKWNGLEGAAKAEAIFRLTGVEIEGLPADSPLRQEFETARENARRSSCQSNLKQIALGIAQYTQDYDERLPLAKPWIDILQPYLKSEQIFRCPSVTDAKGYGYAYNSKLSSKSSSVLSSTSETVSVYETTVLKRNAYGMGENLAFRHLGGANYAFADGHVKWFSNTKTPSFKLKP